MVNCRDYRPCCHPRSVSRPSVWLSNLYKLAWLGRVSEEPLSREQSLQVANTRRKAFRERATVRASSGHPACGQAGWLYRVRDQQVLRAQPGKDEVARAEGGRVRRDHQALLGLARMSLGRGIVKLPLRLWNSTMRIAASSTRGISRCGIRRGGRVQRVVQRHVRGAGGPQQVHPYNPWPNDEMLQPGGGPRRDLGESEACCRYAEWALRVDVRLRRRKGQRLWQRRGPHRSSTGWLGCPET